MRWIALIVLLWSLPAFPQAYCVTSNGVDLKSAPDRSGVVTWTVGKFMPLQGTGKAKGSFVEVLDLDGKSHWVQRKNLTTGYQCAVIKAKVARIRSGPGNEFSHIALANYDKYTPLREFGGEDGWTKVQDDIGGRGWISLDQIWKPAGYKLRMTFDGE